MLQVDGLLAKPAASSTRRGERRLALSAVPNLMTFAIRNPRRELFPVLPADAFP